MNCLYKTYNNNGLTMQEIILMDVPLYKLAIYFFILFTTLNNAGSFQEGFRIMNILIRFCQLIVLFSGSNFCSLIQIGRLFCLNF